MTTKDTTKELIQEARNRKKEIAKMIKQDNGNRYVAMYESENGYTLSTIAEGHHTRNTQISFADYDKLRFNTSLEQVETEINDFEFYHNAY